MKSEVRLQDANQCVNSLAKASQKVVVFEENICAGGYDKLHACKGDSGKFIKFQNNPKPIFIFPTS